MGKSNKIWSLKEPAEEFFVYAYLGVTKDDDKDTILKKCIKKAYIDMTPRNIAGLKEAREKNNNYKDELNKVFNNLKTKFNEYFGSEDAPQSAQDFDSWHKDICNNFKNDYKDFLNKQNVKYEIKYGKAQKIVNMTFKYLYCIDVVDDKYFKYCHMALDQYTLKWYNKEYDDKYRNNNEYKPSDYNYRVSSGWSNLDDKTYYNIQKLIRIMLTNKCPFVEEFTIWQTYKQNDFKKRVN